MTSIETVCHPISSHFDATVSRKTQDQADLMVYYYTAREDHFMCGSSDCSCDEQEGWCDKWAEECEAPALHDFDEFVKKTFDEAIHKEFNMGADVGEKGTLFITVTRKKDASPPAAHVEEGEPALKKSKNEQGSQ